MEDAASFRSRPASRVDRPKIAWRSVHGVLLIDKPRGIGSTAALGRARRALRAEKGGHTGTLDPLASGLLPLCFGEATKFASDLLDADKVYATTIRLGVSTTTGDAEGGVLATRPVEIDRAAIDRVLERFRGPIVQVPPMHSALKHDGRPLYDYARRGITIERAARPVTIHEIAVTGFAHDELSLRVHCSKGTYIRTLGEDIGDALGCGGHLSALRRLAVGTLAVEGAVALDAFEALGADDRDALLLPVDTLIAGLPRIDLSDELARRFVDGQRLSWPGAEAPGRVRVYRGTDVVGDGGLLGTGLLGDDERLAPVRLVANPSH